MKIIDAIPPELLQAYMARRVTSDEVARRTGYHAAAIRRAIKRDPKPPEPRNKTALFEARKTFRKSIAHLPPKQIQKLANVSASTADRIRREYRSKP
jgi:hypothetical protein